MSTARNTMTAALAAAALAGAVFSSTGAEARPRWHPGYGWGAAAVGGLAIAGALAASQAYAAPVYVEDAPIRRCHMVERINRYGEVIGYRRVCRRYY